MLVMGPSSLSLRSTASSPLETSAQLLVPAWLCDVITGRSPCFQDFHRGNTAGSSVLTLTLVPQVVAMSAAQPVPTLLEWARATTCPVIWPRLRTCSQHLFKRQVGCIASGCLHLAIGGPGAGLFYSISILFNDILIDFVFYATISTNKLFLV